LGNTKGQILGSAIEMASHPYNSAALPRSLWYRLFNLLFNTDYCSTKTKLRYNQNANWYI